MKREFALAPGGPKRLTITYSWGLTNAEVSLDGQRIASFPTKADFQRGTTCELPDGSLLSVRYRSVEGAPFLKGVHLIRNGAPIPGSAADPVPNWAWVFIVACLSIPVISLGGALPALIAGAGISGTLSLARFNRWSVAMRAGGCALLTLGCWASFGMLAMAFRPAGPPQWKVPVTKALFMSSVPEKLMDEIEANYTMRGYQPKAISQIRETLRQSCDRMERSQCVAYLRTALLDAQSGHTD